MEPTTKQQLVERLTARMDIHRIFLFSYPHLKTERQQLLLVVNPINGIAPRTLVPIVSLCFSDTEPIPFDMILTGEWQNRLKQGSLYYTYASLPEHEIYTASKKGSLLFAHKTVIGLLELAELNYAKSRKSSDEFRFGAENFITRGDFGQATFMLHQYLELRLKGFLSTMSVNAGKAHNIEHLLKRLPGVSPQLLEVFPDKSPAVDLLRLLDESFTKAKKQDTIVISEDEFRILMGKCESAKSIMDELVEAMVVRVRAYRAKLLTETEQPRSAGAMVTKKKECNPATVSVQVICEDFSGFPWPEQYKKDVNALLDRIQQTHRPEQVILLNYRTGGFSGNFLTPRPEESDVNSSRVELYLAVLKNNKGPFHFNCMKVGDASAMVLFKNVDKIKGKLAAGNRFVNTLWTNGLTLRKKSTFNPEFTITPVNWENEREQAQICWKNAKACMRNLNEVIQKSPNIMLDTGLLLINNLLEIGVQTFLRCAVGYVPYQVHLVELLDWSAVVSMELINYFDPKSEVEKERLRLAAIPQGVWWQNIPLGLSDTSLSFHRGRAAEIMQFFDRVMAEALKGLDGKLEAGENAESMS